MNRWRETWQGHRDLNRVHETTTDSGQVVNSWDDEPGAGNLHARIVGAPGGTPRATRPGFPPE